MKRFALVAMLFALSAPVYAQDAGGSTGQEQAPPATGQTEEGKDQASDEDLRAFDVNGDGKLDQTELDKKKSYDVDGDGTLSAEERAKIPAKDEGTGGDGATGGHDSTTGDQDRTTGDDKLPPSTPDNTSGGTGEEHKDPEAGAPR
jgi:hypothetical protein